MNCKELYVMCGRVPGFPSDKGLSQQPAAFLKNRLLHFRFGKSQPANLLKNELLQSLYNRRNNSKQVVALLMKQLFS